ncbi:glycosyltransferase [Patescibacteria group bacterium]|nr:glycosyltransferase [Patescibacteria group bacterium]
MLKDTIDSVLKQRHTNWEVLVIDDGSTDDTEGAVREYNDERIKYFSQENQGPHVARNRGMELSIGNLIAYLDSDNTLYPNYMERMVREFELNQDAVWGFPMGDRIKELYRDGVLVTRIDDSDDFPEQVSAQDIFHRKLHTDTTGAMHTRKIIEDGVRWDPAIKKMEDWDFFLSLAERYPDGFKYVPEKLYTYTQRFGGDGLVSNSTYRDWADLFERIYQKHKDAPLMQGQTWYPGRVEKWNKLADDFEAGLLPPYQEYYF